MDEIGEEHFPWKGNDKIEDCYVRAIGLYGEDMNLFCGNYIQANYETDVMIKKGANLKKETVDILSDYFHPNIVRLVDFFTEGGNHGRFVVSKVDTSLSAWLKEDGNNSFDENGKMTVFFRNSIIDLCDLIESLLAKGIIIVNGVQMEDLYFKISPDGTLKLVFLPAEVKRPQYPAHDVKATWISIRKLINSCCTECGVELNSLVKDFSDFIGKETFTLEKLKGYPDTWDYKKKGEYLLSLHVAKQPRIRSQMQGIGIKWPFSEPQHVLPDLLNQILKDSELNGFDEYNENDPYEYTRVLKNSYKHFEGLPKKVQSTLVNREGLLRQLERWTPDFWKKIYEKIGTP